MQLCIIVKKEEKDSNLSISFKHLQPCNYETYAEDFNFFGGGFPPDKITYE